MRRIPARFPEERPRGPWSIKTRLKEMAKAGSGLTGGSTSSYRLEASVLPDASAGFWLGLLVWRVQVLLQAETICSVYS